MVLVTLSVVVTIAVLNVNFRSPVTHKMAPWVHRVFITMLPKVLFIERPPKDEDEATTVIATTPGSENTCVGIDDGKSGEGAMGIFEIPDIDKFGVYQKRYSPTEYELSGALRYDGPFDTTGLPPLPPPLLLPAGSALSSGEDDICGGEGGGGDISPSFEKCIAQEIEKAITDARFIAQHVKNKDKFENVSIIDIYFHINVINLSFLVRHFMI
jgi:nicotinic acetylcholine receptor